MNKELKAVLLGLGVFTAAYLSGCFVEADFNITHWNSLTRLFVGLFGMVFAVMTTSMHYNEIKND